MPHPLLKAAEHDAAAERVARDEDGQVSTKAGNLCFWYVPEDAPTTRSVAQCSARKSSVLMSQYATKGHRTGLKEFALQLRKTPTCETGLRLQ